MTGDVAQFVKRAVATMALAAATFGLGGCQGVTGSTSVSQIRFIDASIEAGGLDIYMSNAAVAYNLGFGTITSYIPAQPATYTVAANAAGSRTALASTRASLGAGRQYTVVFGNLASGLAATLLTDQAQPAPSGQVSLRFIDQATHVGPMDIYAVPPGKKITEVSPIYSNLTLGSNTGYINIPTGSYALYILNNGTVPVADTVALYTGGQVGYPAGSARTLVLIDQQVVSTPAMQVITANDYDSATATPTP